MVLWGFARRICIKKITYLNAKTDVTFGDFVIRTRIKTLITMEKLMLTIEMLNIVIRTRINIQYMYIIMQQGMLRL